MRLRDESKEQAIREKAIEMIVTSGFDGLSMQKLAKAANVSPGTIYLYFKNREDLLNQLYMGIDKVFSEWTLKDFDPDMTFEEGLWLQWKNRLAYNIRYPHHVYFMEQFRTSPLIDQKGLVRNSFKEAMGKFYHNAVKRNEIIELPVEIFWSLAYGPLYTLIRFHFGKKSLMGTRFTLTEQKMRITFERVVRALSK